MPDIRVEMKSNLDKTIEQLENDKWPEPDYDSYLIKTTFSLRKKRLGEFETEDLRIMIGQDIGLEYLIPLAINRLNEDILAEGHFYPGDLLSVVLNADKNFWIKHKDHWQTIKNLFEKNRELFEQGNTFKELKKALKFLRK
jgi:hypothetical protein